MAEYEPSDALVEAAARAIDPEAFTMPDVRPVPLHWVVGMADRRLTAADAARAVLREVAPTLLAQGWDEGLSNGIAYQAGSDEARKNPYSRKGAS